MAFTLEDGTGVTDSNSYADDTFADAYFAERSVSGWTGTQAVKQAALIRATDYIEQRFGSLFIGSPVATTQSLSWPRTEAGDYGSDEIPVKLKRAVCEYALRALTAELAPDPAYDTSGARVVTTRQKLGPLEKQVTVLGQGSPSPIRAYPKADMFIAPLIVSSARVIRG